jgi:predicted patatin/cPLA2 family phospholipase
MPGLVLEGGTFRPIFSAGVMDALLDEDIMFPYCIGVSAGITDGFSYASRQKERNLKILQRYRNDKRYLGAGNLLKDKSIFGVEFVFEEIPNNLLPFDWESFAR